ncbi:hypothetical protein [Actinomyces vulturis]|uniref:hypothetical protein n=1 Tax=Actinomyces vulturis TaxID=1857645 RepID=UPI000834895A|nr:hypothetical protein [Actinomyces vulturis]
MNPLTVQQALESEPMGAITKNDCYVAFNWVYSRLDETNNSDVALLVDLDYTADDPIEYSVAGSTLYTANCLDLVIPEELMAPIHAEAKWAFDMKNKGENDVLVSMVIENYQNQMALKTAS